MGIVLTVFLYEIGRRLYQRIPSPLTMPVLTAAAMLMAVLLFLQIPYHTYIEQGGSWMTKLLGPGIVALAIPLYKQRGILKRYAVPILGGAVVGTLVAIMSDLVISFFLGADQSLILTMLPKSVTMPVAMSVSEEIGGIPSLTAVFVIIAGITGVLTGPWLLQWSGVTSFIGKGISVGCSSHMMGVTQAMNRDEREGVIGSVTMTLAAVLTCVLGPLFARLFV
ncbi:LrgB family protein [Ectobacillus ponti]|uniref:LrgB family protein n=1 Tax=Ectobacillus ponti TaxID=2961894 RepID=A0AA41XBT4_9BACI|nr:LrgB family protein [Ectobacillus ponti]MCP8969998.1 LrgB family protein [Ectobacillus ponti]